MTPKGDTLYENFFEDGGNQLKIPVGLIKI